MRQAPDWIIVRPGWPSAVWCLRSRPANALPAGQWPPARRDQHLTTGMFSHFTPETVALLTSVQDSALEEWAAGEPAASPRSKLSWEWRSLVNFSISLLWVNAIPNG